MRLTFSRATLDDERLIREMQAEAIDWLAATGTDQWQPAAMQQRLKHRAADRGLVPSLKRGEVLLVHNDIGEAVGTLTVDRYADPEFWTEDDDPDSAIYIHRMIVPRRAAGNNIGGAMLDWVTDQAANAELKWVRLDAWRTNAALHNYYRRHGFQHVRTVNLPHRGSGALFQRAVGTQ